MATLPTLSGFEVLSASIRRFTELRRIDLHDCEVSRAFGAACMWLSCHKLKELHLRSCRGSSSMIGGLTAASNPDCLLATLHIEDEDVSRRSLVRLIRLTRKALYDIALCIGPYMPSDEDDEEEADEELASMQSSIPGLARSDAVASAHFSQLALLRLQIRRPIHPALFDIMAVLQPTNFAAVTMVDEPNSTHAAAALDNSFRSCIRAWWCLEALELHGVRMSPKMFNSALFVHLEGLTELTIRGCLAWTMTAFSALQHVKSLSRLSVSRLPLGAELLSALATFPHLQEIICDDVDPCFFQQPVEMAPEARSSWKRLSRIHFQTSAGTFHLSRQQQGNFCWQQIPPE